MTKQSLLTSLKSLIEDARHDEAVDLEHAKNACYESICVDIYFEGKKKRQQANREHARFHDGRSKGHQDRANTLLKVLELVEGLDTRVDTVPNPATIPLDNF